ncbi:MAG TPA: BatA domain-containing protein, partial [Segetibacter sp.]|nr:BatA domain-containing protein [Segetibacter sp.]
MLQFLQPILLFSLAGIAIPVVIHLWNIKQGKTLKIGSITLLTQGSRQSAQNFQLTQLLLLFLRCLLLTLLAFLIAEPVWKQVSANKEKGWILLEKESLNEGYKNNKSKIDSLLKAGYEFHYFSPAFKKDKLEEALKMQKDTLVSHPVPYWSLLAQLNHEISDSVPVYLFTANRLNRFSGDRPPLSLNLHWQVFIPADSVTGWPENAFLTSSDSVRLLIGHSKPSGTFYTHANLSLTRMSDADYHVDVINGKLIVSLKDTSKEKNTFNRSNIEVDTSAIRITLFTDKFTNDANYIRAAISAIQNFSKRKLIFYTTNNYMNLPANQDWIFWLSEQAVPAFANAKNIFMYARGKSKNINSWITSEDVSTTNQEGVLINKVIVHNTANDGKIIWQDGFGSSVLSEEAKNNTRVFHFYSRLNPDWSDLPWSEKFPKLMFSLIFRNENYQGIPYNDRRIIDENQIAPYRKA